MNKIALALVIFVNILTASTVYAIDMNQDLSITSPSAYPDSSLRNAPPEIPDHVYGKSTHNVPSGIPATSGSTSDPSKDAIPDEKGDSSKD